MMVTSGAATTQNAVGSSERSAGRSILIRGVSASGSAAGPGRAPW